MPVPHGKTQCTEINFGKLRKERLDVTDIIQIIFGFLLIVYIQTSRTKQTYQFC